MAIRIENKSTLSLPSNHEKTILEIIESVPREHLRGLSRIVIVDKIIPEFPVSYSPQMENLPGLYHPKMGTGAAWLEISATALLPAESFFKKQAARINFKSNLAAILYSLLAQHHHLTFSYGVKKGRIESAVRSYTETYYEQWRNKQGGFRVKLFKPFRPWLEKWAKSLQKKYNEEKKKQSA